MVNNNMKITFATTRPKFGMKGYKMQTTYQLDPIYKIDSFSMNKKDKPDHYTDLEA